MPMLGIKGSQPIHVSGSAVFLSSFLGIFGRFQRVFATVQVQKNNRQVAEYAKKNSQKS
jgi:hypothetical protein